MQCEIRGSRQKRRWRTRLYCVSTKQVWSISSGLPEYATFQRPTFNIKNLIQGRQTCAKSIHLTRQDRRTPQEKEWKDAENKPADQPRSGIGWKAKLGPRALTVKNGQHQKLLPV